MGTLPPSREEIARMYKINDDLVAELDKAADWYDVKVVLRKYLLMREPIK